MASSNWVRMNQFEFELVWVRVLCKMAESKMAEFKMAAIIKLSENEGLWVRLNESEKWLIQDGWTQDGCQSSWVRMNEVASDWIMFESESDWSESVFEWIWEMITRCLNPRWQCLNPIWQNFKMAAIIKLSQNEWVKFFLCKMAESNMAKFMMAAIIKLSGEWRSLSQIELVWVRVLCKMAESKMAEFNMAESRWLPSSS